MKKKIFIPIIIIALLSACATVTKVQTNPIGAKLYVNGEYVGETPAIYHSERDLGRRYRFQLQKEGYEPLDFYVDSQLDWFLGYGMYTPYVNMFLGWTTFWAWGLDDGMKINMQSISQNNLDTDGSKPSNTDKF